MFSERSRAKANSSLRLYVLNRDSALICASRDIWQCVETFKCFCQASKTATARDKVGGFLGQLCGKKSCSS